MDFHQVHYFIHVHADLVSNKLSVPFDDDFE